MTLAGWINRQQQDVIAYIQEENRILKSKLEGKRIRFTDDERRRLGNRLNDPRKEFGATDGPVTCRERLGGLLRYYYRQAA